MACQHGASTEAPSAEFLSEIRETPAISTPQPTYDRSMRTPATRGSAWARAASPAVLALVVATGCDEPPGELPPPDIKIGEGEGEGVEGEGEGEGTGVVLDCPTDAGGATLDELADRFTTDIYPLMAREDLRGCIACHAEGSGRQMTMLASSTTAGRDTFFR